MNIESAQLLGEHLGEIFANEVTRAVWEMRPELRPAFFGQFLGWVSGIMGASLGEEAACELLDSLKRLVVETRKKSPEARH